MVYQICPAETSVGAGGNVATGNSGSPGVASLGSPALGTPRKLTIGVIADAATTLTINVSYDGTNWMPASFADGGTKATITLAGAGGQAVDITPAPYVQIVSSGACHLTAWAYGA